MCEGLEKIRQEIEEKRKEAERALYMERKTYVYNKTARVLEEGKYTYLRFFVDHTKEEEIPLKEASMYLCKLSISMSDLKKIIEDLKFTSASTAGPNYISLDLRK